MRYLITFSYDGSKYNGYQKQPGLKTIQGEIEQALFKINSNKPVIISAAGRTDKGVHALNQKAHFDLDIAYDEKRLLNSLNHLLPSDIYIKDLNKVVDAFHARFAVIKKEYIYKINIGLYNPIMKDYCLQYNRLLDIKAMNLALKYFEGEHNFKAFTKKSEEKEDYVRIIYKASLELVDNILTISLIGNGFLRYMVRNIVGTLIEIGEHKRTPMDIIELIKMEDRTKIGATAKPNGLYLKDIWYKN